MRHVVRWFVGIITIAHGVLHLLGTADGLEWAEIDAFEEPISRSMGGVWLGAAVLVVVAGVSILRRRSGWWPIAAVAAGVSQLVILTSWSDAWAGTVPNVLLALAAFYGYRSHGTGSARSRYRRWSAELLAAVRADAKDERLRRPIGEDDLAVLPAPVAAYVRDSGAVGRPPVVGFRAAIHGRIRSDTNAPWMKFTGEQVNTFGPHGGRLYYMDATMKGLPVDVLHAYRGAHATMQVSVASIHRMVDAAGPEMDRSETVTLFNDLCLLAPAALASAPVTWSPATGPDDGDEQGHQRVRAEFTHAEHTVTAELVFDAGHRLVDFVSDDRSRSAPDGRSFTRQRWSTPIVRWGEADGRAFVAEGIGRWHPPDGAVDYVEFMVDDIVYIEPQMERPHVGPPTADAADVRRSTADD